MGEEMTAYLVVSALNMEDSGYLGIFRDQPTRALGNQCLAWASPVKTKAMRLGAVKLRQSQSTRLREALADSSRVSRSFVSQSIFAPESLTTCSQRFRSD